MLKYYASGSEQETVKVKELHKTDTNTQYN